MICFTLEFYVAGVQSHYFSVILVFNKAGISRSANLHSEIPMSITSETATCRTCTIPKHNNVKYFSNPFYNLAIIKSMF